MNKKFRYLTFLLLILTSIMFLVNENFLLELTINSFGFFNGYSTSKFIWFIFILISFVYFFEFLKNKKIIKQCKNIKIEIFLFLIIILSLLNLFSLFIFLENNNLGVFDLSYVIYDGGSTFTGTSISHNHTFKPILWPLSIFNLNGFDLGLEIVSFMPQWFNIIYFIGPFLFICLFISSFCFIKNKIPKKDYSKLWLFISSFFLISKSIIDGGIFNIEFFVGISILIYLIINNKTNNNFLLKLKLFLSFLIIDILFRYLIVSNVEIINFEQFIYLSLKSITTFIGLYFVIFIIYFILKNIRKNNKLIKILPAGIILFLIISSAFSFFEVAKAVNLEDYETVNEKIENQQKIAFIPYAINDFEKIEILNIRDDLIVAKVLEDTSIRELSIWKSNIKSIDYIYPWNNSCNVPIVQKTINIKTNENFKLNNYNSSILILNIKEVNNNTYTMTFLHSTCIDDIRGLIVENLKQIGLNEFIIFE
jgi:hypothetical protein